MNDTNLNIIQKPSVNFDERIRFIVLHYTDCDFQTSLAKLTEAKYQVSSHYFVAKNGDIFQLVAENKRAWHAGISSWDDIDNINFSSIGIEIENIPLNPYPDTQINSVINLVRDIKKRYNIKDNNIIGHSDIAPGRKIDPGKLFPWAHLAQEGLGLYLLDKIRDNKPDQSYQANISNIQQHLSTYGYKISVTNNLDSLTLSVVKAFNDHFYPEIYAKNPNIDHDKSLLWDNISDIIINYLLQAKNSL